VNGNRCFIVIRLDRQLPLTRHRDYNWGTHSRQLNLGSSLMTTEQFPIQTIGARREGISTLYRYMPYPAPNDVAPGASDRRTWVHRVLTHAELYFPLAPQFNDPFEAAPHFRIPRHTDGSIDTDVYIHALRTKYGPAWGWSEQQIDEAEAFLSQRVRAGTFEADTLLLEQKQVAWLHSDFPMCCLTRDRGNVPMWSYYAGSHTGVCIHFDAINSAFGSAFKVIYSDDYPFIPQPAMNLPPMFMIQQLVLTKATAWAHEAEYRLIDMPNQEARKRALDPPITVRPGPQLYQFPTKHVVGITCGARMSDDAIGQIIEICGNRKPRLPVYRARKLEHKFGLAFDDLRV
jgi:hypothetical protein